MFHSKRPCVRVLCALDEFLPDELLRLALSFLSLPSLILLRQVSRRFRRLEEEQGGLGPLCHETLFDMSGRARFENREIMRHTTHWCYKKVRFKLDSPHEECYVIRFLRFHPEVEQLYIESRTDTLSWYTPMQKSEICTLRLVDLQQLQLMAGQACPIIPSQRLAFLSLDTRSPPNLGTNSQLRVETLQLVHHDDKKNEIDLATWGNSLLQAQTLRIQYHYHIWGPNQVQFPFHRQRLTSLKGLKRIEMLANKHPHLKRPVTDDGKLFQWHFRVRDDKEIAKPWELDEIKALCTPAEVDAGMVMVDVLELWWQREDLETAQLLRPITVHLQCCWDDLECYIQNLEDEDDPEPPWPVVRGVQQVRLKAVDWREERYPFVRPHLEQRFPGASIAWF